MARTLSGTKIPGKAKIRGKAKKREMPLGTAISLGLAATLITGIIVFLVLFLIPGTAAHNFFRLAHNNASATLPLDPLYQQWYEKISEEDALFGTPLSLLCGGLALGWLAPGYAPLRRVLLSGAALGFGIPAASLAFLWVGGVIEQNTLNVHEGGQQVILTAPTHLILIQTLCVFGWTAVCVFGTWLGVSLRARGRVGQGV